MYKLFLPLFFILTFNSFAGIKYDGFLISGITSGDGELRTVKPMILCMGDSITRGADTEHNSYRGPLQDLLGLGKYNFVGAYSWGSAKYDTDNSGVAGENAKSITDRFISTEIHNFGDSPKNKIIIYAGINDYGDGHTVETTSAEIERLLRFAHYYFPNTAIYVCLINSTQNGNLDTWITNYNVLNLALVNSFKSVHSKTYAVDVRTLFESNPDYKTEYYFDDYHPNEAGNAVIAQAIYNSIIANEGS